MNLKCYMIDTCTAPVTHMDDKGFVYCKQHGAIRQLYQRCRALKPAELKQLQAGLRLKKY